MANSITRANSRRAALRRRLDGRHPLFADEFFARDTAQFRAFYQGRRVLGPTHRRRRRPHRRPIDRQALAAVQARQLDLLAWRRPGPVRRVLRAAQRILQRIMGKIGLAPMTKGRTVAPPKLSAIHLGSGTRWPP